MDLNIYIENETMVVSTVATSYSLPQGGGHEHHLHP